jgi:hypothetical protein
MEAEIKGVAMAALTVDTPINVSPTITIEASLLPLLPDPENRFKGQPFMFGYLDSVKWFVLRDYSYRTKAGEVSTVQCSFVFNFADIPALLRWKYPPCGDGRNHYGIAAMWHDWLLKNKTINGRRITRSEADDLFYEIMLYLAVDKHTAWIMYKAVQFNTWQQELRGIPFQTADEPKEGNAT